MEYTNYVPQLAPFYLEPDTNSMSSSSSYYSSLYSSTNPFVPTTADIQQTEFHRKGGRRPKKINGLTPEEQGKVKERRERNKLAAARCRKRRVDHTMELNDEVDAQEIKRMDLQNEIQDLEAQKNELLLMINGHQSECKIQSELKLPVTTYELTNNELQNSVTEVDIKPDSDTLFDFEIPVIRKLSSLSLFSLPTTVIQSQSSGLGLPVNTRSLNNFNFESLMQGGTGLTPQNSFIDNGKKN